MKITLLTSTYNNEDTLPALVASVVDNKEYLHEWIICDDGSTDGTWDMVKALPDYVYGVQQKKHGYWYTRNLNNGLRLATGGVILVLNGDSSLEHEMLRTLSECYLPGSVGSCLRLNFEGDTFKSYDWRYSYGSDEIIDVTDKPFWWCLMTGNGLIAPTKILQKVGWDEKYRDWGSEDWDLVVRLRDEGLRLINYNNIKIRVQHNELKKASKKGSVRFNRLILKKYKVDYEEWLEDPSYKLLV